MKFNGINFRSRLEARWSQVFSAFGWRWEYEPLELNGYIPDFVLLFKAGPVLVEVKPFLALCGDGVTWEAEEKIDKSGWETKNANSALVVGATWNLDTDPSPYGSYGWPIICALRQYWPEHIGFDGEKVEGQHNWDAGLLHYCLEGKHPSVHHCTGSFRCTVCNAYEGDHLLGCMEQHGYDTEQIWREAGNSVQWQARRQ